MNNAWYRHIHDRVKGHQNSSNCFVCSYMPTTTASPTIYGRPMNKSAAKCAASFAGIGMQSSQIQINDTDPHATGLRNGTCDELFWVDFNVTASNTTYPFLIHMPQDTTVYNHTMCYCQENGTNPLGNTTNCDQTAQNGEGAPVRVAQPWTNGTYWVQGMAWLCGNQAYFILPPYWSGTCAPVWISDHTFIVKGTSTDSRTRRSATQVQPHDPIWGKNVPEDFKVWTTGQKVTHALLPWIGVGKHALQIETIDYRLGLFINASCEIEDQQNNQIDMMRTMLMEHQIALDMMLASQGGLCVLFNHTCCTYIPDNVHSENMTRALETLKQLQIVMTNDYVNENDWFSKLFSGTWFELLKKFLFTVGVLLLMLCMFTSCILPCLC
uniref:Envelope protein n=1 Tax=Amphiprion ocellaris TaxID=80972 RepID=A0A3Q1BH59_AMPOC